MTLSLPLFALLMAGGQVEAAQAAPPAAERAPSDTAQAPVAAPPAAPSPAASSPDVAAPDPGAEIVRREPPPQDDIETIQVVGNRLNKVDPLNEVNLISFQVVQAVDRNLVGPTAMSYRRYMPKPIRNGLRNALNNLRDPGTTLNHLLQLKPGRAVRTAGRFIINSTLGIGGLFDFAKRKPFNIPFQINGFANTMGYYGVGPGPYLFLPLIGSTTVRDVIGRMLDLSLLPTVVGTPFTHPAYTLTAGTVNSIDERADRDEEIRRVRQSANPYALTRELYLQTRRADIEALHTRRGSQTEEAPPAPALPAPTQATDVPAAPPAASPPADAAPVAPAESAPGTGTGAS